MALNKRLLRKVRNRIAKIPESYDQGNWETESDESPCGTAACLAGETIICSQPTVEKGITLLKRLTQTLWASRTSWTGTPKKAAVLLGLTKEEAEGVFDGGADGWPSPYGARFRRAKLPATRAKIAVEYLDECLKRGKMIW